MQTGLIQADPRGNPGRLAGWCRELAIASLGFICELKRFFGSRLEILSGSVFGLRDEPLGFFGFLVIPRDVFYSFVFFGTLGIILIPSGAFGIL